LREKEIRLMEEREKLELNKTREVEARERI
jgi:hypothetical protein